MANIGIAPPAYDTPVGQVRANLGDTEFIPLDPPVQGMGDYQYFSDKEIEAFLTQAGGSVALATSIAYSRLASAWNVNSITIRQDDMAYSNKDSVGTWLNMARFWKEIADQEAVDAGNDYGDIIYPAYGCGCGYEYAPHLGKCAAPGYQGC